MILLKRYLFLLDGCGALLTAFFVGVVLPRCDVGLPDAFLTGLAAIALGFSAYSLGCFFLKKTGGAFLKAIIVANSLYCLLTTTVVLCFFSSISAFGIVYFTSEILVISILVAMEIKILRFP